MANSLKLHIFKAESLYDLTWEQYQVLSEALLEIMEREHGVGKKKEDYTVRVLNVRK